MLPSFCRQSSRITGVQKLAASNTKIWVQSLSAPEPKFLPLYPRQTQRGPGGWAWCSPQPPPCHGKPQLYVLWRADSAAGVPPAAPLHITLLCRAFKTKPRTQTTTTECPCPPPKLQPSLASGRAQTLAFFKAVQGSKPLLGSFKQEGTAEPSGLF